MPSVIAGVFHDAGVVAHVVPSAEYSYVVVSTPDAFAPPGSPVVATRLTEPRTAWAGFPCAGSAREAVGAVRSSSHVNEAGVPSVLPAASSARTWKVCVPSAGVASACGVVHVVHEPPSSLHW